MNNKTKVGILRMAVLGMLVVVMTGCSFDVSIPVLKGQVLPGVSSVIEIVEDTDKSDDVQKAVIGPISLGQICTFTNTDVLREDLLAAAEENVPGVPVFLLRIVKITGVLLNEVEFSATTGNFSTINQITMDIGADGENSGLYEAVNSEGFDASVKLAPETQFDLLNDVGGGCIDPSLTLEGTTPADDVVFDLIMHLTINYRVGLF